MAIAPGSRLGPYEIIDRVAAGGMGEVFKARDTRLNRTVAIKILPPDVAGDPLARERFEREARAIARLTHPHICTLHDVGRQDGLDYLVLEFVEGDTLEDRLVRGALPVAEALKVAAQIADALDRAHRAGVVHRDLKPANIMLARSGAKLLDFGIAKAHAASPFSESTVGDTRTLTQLGTMLGTAPYMAPEQLEGGEVDARTDIFALGGVLFEMLTGRRAFEGNTHASVIAAILYSTPPPPSTLQPLVPAALDHIVARCLAREPDNRWQTARDLLLELRTHADPGTTRSAVPATAQPFSRPRGTVGALITALVIALVAVGALLLRGVPAAPIVRATIAAPPGARFDFSGDFGGPPVLSPDGRRLAFVATDGSGRRRLWVRPLDTVEARAIPGADDATFPFWSPDGRAVGFFMGGKLKRVDVDEGAVLTLCDAPSGRGGTWSAGNVILFTPSVRDGIYQVSASGGEPQAVTRVDRARHTSHRWPEVLPDGRSFVYLAVPRDAAQRDESAIFIASLDGGAPEPLVRSGTQASVVDGELLYVRDSTLVRQRLDRSRRKLAGEPTVVAQDVQHDPTIWRAVFSVSAGGPLVYQSGGEGGRSVLAWFDRAGRRLGSVGEPGIYFDINISPDGARVAVNRDDPADIWVYELARGTGSRVTFDPRNESLPIWSPDSTQLMFSAVTEDNRGMLALARADGAVSPTGLLVGDVAEATGWSPDGRFVLVKPADKRSAGGDVWVMPVADPAARFAFVATSFAEYHAQFSPDGRWVSYVSNESGRDEVYVTAFSPPRPGDAPKSLGHDPARPGRWQISTGGGVLPRWRRDGLEMYYLGPDGALMAAAIDGRGTRFVVSQAQPLFKPDPKPVGWLYDAAPDGQRFLVDTLGDAAEAPLVLVLNAPLGR
jgi:eukaryotic-like serine/threonine-protein kinase